MYKYVRFEMTLYTVLYSIIHNWIHYICAKCAC